MSQLEQPQAPTPTPQELPGRSFWLWGRDMLFSLAVSFFIITFLYQPVPSTRTG